MLKIYRKLSLCLAFCVLAMPLFGDTSHQMTGVTAIPNITIDPTQLIFGEVELGMTKELPLTVGNSGSSDIHVSALQLTGRDADNFSIYSGNAPFAVSPGATHVITIQFEPLFDCSKIADLNIISDDPVNGTEVVPLSGKGCGADIYTNDNGQFGDVFDGSDQDKSIDIGNCGERECIVSSTDIIGPNAADFSIESGGGAFTMPHHTNRELIVRFTPSSTGLKTATISMDTNDPLDDPFQIQLSGTGITNTDISVQPAGYNYGALQAGEFADHTFQVSNTGPEILEVSSTILFGSHAGEFSIESGGGSFSLTSGSSRDLIVRFSPQFTGHKYAYLRISSNDPDEGEFDVSLCGRLDEAKVEVNPESRDYETVVIGSEKNRKFVVQNTGTVHVTVNQTIIEGNDHTEFKITSGAAPFTIPPEQSREIRVSFLPQSEGNESAELYIGLDFTDLHIALTGTGMQPHSDPDLVPLSQSLDFGELDLGCTDSRDLGLVNGGGLELIICSMQISDPSSFSLALKSQESALLKAAAGSPDTLTIAPGDTEIVTIHFHPETEGEKQAVMTIESNDPDESLVQIEIQGIGTAPEEVPMILKHCYPFSEAMAVPVNTPVQFMIQGLTDPVTQILNVTINGVNIVNGGADQTGGQTSVQILGNRCHVRYQPTAPFEENGIVTVEIQCGSQIDSTYSFSTGWGMNREMTRATVTPHGGSITCDSTHICMEVPENAVEDTVEISVGIISNVPALPDSVQGLGLSYHFGPEGLQFDQPVTIGLPYTADDMLNANVTDPMDFQVYYFITSTGEWVKLELVSADNDCIYVLVNQFCCLTLGTVEEQSMTGLYTDSGALPNRFSLSQNYPNPFNPSTSIQYDLSEATRVQIRIYDITGREIRTLVNTLQPAGRYVVRWDATDENHESVSSGVYMVEILTPEFRQIRKMMLVR